MQALSCVGVRQLHVAPFFVSPTAFFQHGNGAKHAASHHQAVKGPAAVRPAAPSVNHQAKRDNPAVNRTAYFPPRRMESNPAAHLKPKRWPVDADPHDFSSSLLAAIKKDCIDHAQALLHGPRAVLEPFHFEAVVAKGSLPMLELLLLEPVRMEAYMRAPSPPAGPSVGGNYPECYSRHRYQAGCGASLWNALIKQGNGEMAECVLDICMRPAHPFFASTREAANHKCFKSQFLLAAAKVGNLEVVNELLSAIQFCDAQYSLQLTDIHLWQDVLMTILEGTPDKAHPARTDPLCMQRYLCTIQAILQHPSAGHASRATFRHPRFCDAATCMGVPVLDMLQSLRPPCRIGSDLMSSAINSENAEVMAWVAMRQPTGSSFPDATGPSQHWRVQDSQPPLYAAARQQLAHVVHGLFSDTDSPVKDFPLELTQKICRLVLPPLQQELGFGDIASGPVPMAS